MTNIGGVLDAATGIVTLSVAQENCDPVNGSLNLSAIMGGGDTFTTIVGNGPNSWLVTPADGSAPFSITDQQFDEQVVFDSPTTGQITFIDDDGVSTVYTPPITPDLCTQIAALDPLAPGQVVLETVGVLADGTCVRVPAPCHIEADAANAPWDSDNPNWVDPATVADGCSMLLKNSLESGAAGSSSFWRVLESGSGHQWHQTV